MGLFQVVCTCLLAAIAQTQVLQDCSVDTSPVTVGSTEDAAALATSLQCSNGDFAVEWVGEFFVEESIIVTGGTSLSIAGAGPGAGADGGGNTQLFSVDGGSSLHLSDMTLTAGYATIGGAILASQSVVSLAGNISFISNHAISSGGAIYAYNSSVSWDGDGTEFIDNSADTNGGAIFAANSNVSWGAHGTTFSRNSAGDDGGNGGAIYATNSNVSWDGDDATFTDNSAYESGGAIYAWDSSIVSWNGDNATFSSNSAAILYVDPSGVNYVFSGGAIFAWRSTVSWVGDYTQFTSNLAKSNGGGIYAWESTVSWVGGYTQFTSNGVGDSFGGAICAEEYSNVLWDGDGTGFSLNFADSGGAIAPRFSSVLSWNGDGTEFGSNFVGTSGGAIAAYSSSVSWDGDGTTFRNNSADFRRGGAISLTASANVSWVGGGTEFISNSAGEDGGGIHAHRGSTVSLGQNTIFSNNTAAEAGGALAIDELGSRTDRFVFLDVEFIGNRAELGGAVYLFNFEEYMNFTDVTFQSNSASVAGGAVVAYAVGDVFTPATFSRCFFSNNTSDGDGGAVDTLAGEQEFISCEFQGNSADVGGAVRLGGTADIRNCSFLSNSASTRGLAVAVVGSATISGSVFDGNGVYCAAGSYRKDTEKEDSAARFNEVCFDCPGWDECSGCTIKSGDVTPTCEAPLAHTAANEPGTSLETLEVDGGYWRAVAESDNILPCYNADACRGGLTGADSFCASGYKGPYCAVCETDYSSSLAHTCTRCSSSRRQGLVAATVIAAIVAVLAVVTIFIFLLSVDLEESNTGCFHRRVLQAVPVQALKIVVVVWQILTQFAVAANVTYPGVYQDFLSAIDVINFDLGSVLAVGCLWSGVDFHGRLLVSTLGPLVAVGFLAMTHMIAVRRNGASSDAAVAEKIRHKHQTALLLLTFLMYSSVSSMVFQTFACETLDDDVEYLRADYRIHCTDAKHKAFEVYAGIMVFVYPVGIPLLYAVLLFQSRDVLAHAGADKTVAQSIAGLWEPYRPERFYYEVVECGRRISLTGVVVFIFPNTAAQVAITILIAFFFSMVFEVLSPYTSESDMWLSRGGHVIVFLSMFDLLLLKVDVSGERDQSQAAFAGVLVAGHLLMILAIVVEVVGICYASRKKKVGEGEEATERPRAGSGDVAVFESAPASWRSFLRQRSVSEKTGPTRSISGTVVTTGRP